MSLSKFGGLFNALSYYYGGPNPDVCPPPLVIQSAPASDGVGSVTLESGVMVLTDGSQAYPLDTNADVLVGCGANQETVTPTAVTSPESSAPGSAGFTADFANVHGVGDRVASATCGLQEAINDANRRGGGKVTIDSAWANAGGTTAIKNAAVFPSPTIVEILDYRT